jgi:hypothetical protein
VFIIKDKICIIIFPNETLNALMENSQNFL